MKTKKVQIMEEIECKNLAYKAFLVYERDNGINVVSLYVK